MLLEGIFAAATTPFYPDSSLYLRKLEHNIERYSRTPVAGIVVLGSTGEAVLLDDAETRETLRTAALSAAPEKVLVAGVGQQGAVLTIRLAEFAATAGYDAVLVRTPFYYAPHMSPLAMLTYYRTVADHSPLPVILYSIPKFTHYDMPVELIAELAHHPNIIGLKDSSGSVERIAAIAEATRAVPKKTFNVTSIFSAVTRRMHAAAIAPKEPSAQLVTIGGTVSVPPAPSLTNPSAEPNPKWRTRSVGFQLLCGAADKLLPSLQAGATGAVLALAAPAPQACHEL
jgi:4-hydroxy-2-oxoglutarate aldolase